MVPTSPFDSSLAIATSAICCAALARLSTKTAERVAAFPPPISSMPRLRSPAMAATTVRPSSATPLKLPRSTFQASTAFLPTVSASLPMMQPPVNTSAVRASTYSPLTEPFPPADNTARGEAKTTSAATSIPRFIMNLKSGTGPQEKQPLLYEFCGCRASPQQPGVRLSDAGYARHDDWIHRPGRDGQADGQEPDEGRAHAGRAQPQSRAG